MKSLLNSRTAVLSAVLVSRVFASQPAATLNVDSVVMLASNPTVARGMSRETVQYMLGIPDAKLSAQVWVYWNFKVKGVPPREAHDDALVVGFTADRVTFLRLCRNEPVRAFLAQQQAGAIASTLVAKQVVPLLPPPTSPVIVGGQQAYGGVVPTVSSRPPCSHQPTPSSQSCPLHER